LIIFNRFYSYSPIFNHYRPSSPISNRLYLFSTVIDRLKQFLLIFDHFQSLLATFHFSYPFFNSFNHLNTHSHSFKSPTTCSNVFLITVNHHRRPLLIDDARPLPEHDATSLHYYIYPAGRHLPIPVRPTKTQPRIRPQSQSISPFPHHPSSMPYPSPLQHSVSLP
jgi:hypothetical protein